MLHYFLRTAEYLGPEVCFLRELPVGFDDVSYMWYDGEPLAPVGWNSPARLDMTKGEPGMQLLDIVPNLNAMLIVSARVRKVIDAHTGGTTEFLPLVIHNHKGRVASQEHCVVNPLGAHDCLDLTESKINWLDGEVVSVDEYVLSAHKLTEKPALLRLREHPSDYVVSSVLADALRAIEPPLTGLVLDPIRVTLDA